ncbi:MAG TPA: IS1595 family transposase, partial [Vicinamibacterales bacterium]|nr:IS1595 family transposase [Vicinamibacterales bacterium]
GQHPRAQFSLKVGTVFEDSPLGLDKWLPALWLLTGCKNGISSYELARALGVTQKSEWFMLHRLRLALHSDVSRKLGGHVEADETYIGGKARNMHIKKRKRMGITMGRSMAGKIAVMGLLERHGNDGQSRIRTSVLTGRKKGHIQPVVREHVIPGSTLHTDAHFSYQGLQREFTHLVVDHAEKYVDGQIHTNGCENFWSLLKRAIKGTYVSVEPFHLFRYLDEQAFRFNERSLNDAGRFFLGLAGIVNRRLTYKALIGSELPQTC